jgi:dihydroorotase-like cyclic amidohydrolase
LWGQGVAVNDYGSLVIAPGLIDLNVKSNGEWEGRSITSQAAISGGVTFYLENTNYYDMDEEM